DGGGFVSGEVRWARAWSDGDLDRRGRSTFIIGDVRVVLRRGGGIPLDPKPRLVGVVRSGCKRIGLLRNASDRVPLPRCGACGIRRIARVDISRRIRGLDEKRSEEV